MRSSKLCKMPTKSSEVLPLSMKHRYTIRALALRHFAVQTFTSSHAPPTKKNTHTNTNKHTHTRRIGRCDQELVRESRFGKGRLFQRSD